MRISSVGEKDHELWKVRSLMFLEWRVCMVLGSEGGDEWAGGPMGNALVGL